jgi:hypothetical protein
MIKPFYLLQSHSLSSLSRANFSKVVYNLGITSARPGDLPQVNLYFEQVP